MQGKKGVSVVRYILDIIILVFIALGAPTMIGFQYIEWLSGGTHFAFMISSTSWFLTYSDWYSTSSDAINRWIFSSFSWIINKLQTDLLWTVTHVDRSCLLLFLFTPIVRLVYVAVIMLYRTHRIEKSVLIVASIAVLGISIASCILSIIANVIYGIPPEPTRSIAAPDTDIKLFVPVPILLLVGLYLSRKVDGGPDGV